MLLSLDLFLYALLLSDELGQLPYGQFLDLKRVKLPKIGS